ncbi:DeoR/GlpR family DNA-binding transcription regulator [Streptobacillus canis]|uniref:DeoR/GlpR family DNA-binding transcription regulator n=1 Tax=Streptobacillus canis TaxID=2678686 RepID=UPI0012E142E1|nr:DeoR/GlpR family DNA-binding transcription regulator [Streptobacillus canis]
MIKIQRHNKIIELLKISGTITISQLSKEFNCSEETIRKDLIELENNSKLKRTHGGAYIEHSFDKGIPLELRETLMKKEKKYIAELAIKHIKNHSSIILDSSTTCIELAKKIYESDLEITIITNSLQIANIFLKSNHVKLIILPGTLNSKYNSMFDLHTLTFLENIKADISFISFPTINIEFGYGDNSIENLKVREKMLSNSKIKIVLLDSTKFNDDSAVFFTKIKNTDIIVTDKKIDKKWVVFFKKNNINIVY